MKKIGQLNKSTNKANIVIFAGHQRKMIKSNDKCLCPDNINSGSCIAGEIVLIWRLEELYKVLIHELIHFYDLDFHSNNENYNDIQNYIMETYNVKPFDSPNESYTETLAIIIYSLFYSYYSKYDFNLIIKYEIMYTFIQISKILKFYFPVFFDSPEIKLIRISILEYGS